MASFGTVEVPMGELPIKDIRNELLERWFLRVQAPIVIATGWTPDTYWSMTYDEHNAMVSWLVESGVIQGQETADGETP